MHSLPHSMAAPEEESRTHSPARGMQDRPMTYTMQPPPRQTAGRGSRSTFVEEPAFLRAMWEQQQQQQEAEEVEEGGPDIDAGREAAADPAPADVEETGNRSWRDRLSSFIPRPKKTAPRLDPMAYPDSYALDDGEQEDEGLESFPTYASAMKAIGYLARAEAPPGPGAEDEAAEGEVIFDEAETARAVPLCVVYTAPARAAHVQVDQLGPCMAAAANAGAFASIGHVGLIIGDVHINVTAQTVYVTLDSVHEKLTYWTSEVEEAYRVGEVEPRHRFLGRFVSEDQRVAIEAAARAAVNEQNVSYTRAAAAFLALLHKVGLSEPFLTHWSSRIGLETFTCVTCVASLLEAGGVTEPGRFVDLSTMTPERFLDTLSDNDDFEAVEYQEWNVSILADSISEWERANAHRR